MKQICPRNNDYFGAQKLANKIKLLPISSSYVNDRCKFVQYCCVDTGYDSFCGAGRAPNKGGQGKAGLSLHAFNYFPVKATLYLSR